MIRERSHTTEFVRVLVVQAERRAVAELPQPRAVRAQAVPMAVAERMEVVVLAVRRAHREKVAVAVQVVRRLLAEQVV